MPVLQRISRSAVDTWIYAQLLANTTLNAVFAGRFWQMGAVLREGDDAFDFPYLVWQGQQINVAQWELPATSIKRLTYRYKARGVWQYDRPFTEADFDVVAQELRNALTGVGGDIPIKRDGTIIGYVDQSAYVSDFEQQSDDGDKRIVERGIVIEVIARGVPAF